MTALSHLPLVADGAEVFVDAEYDQDEFGDDAREHDADDDGCDAGQYHDEPAERADRHRRQPGEDPGNAEQDHQCDGQPVEGLNDRRRDEPVPLKQIPKFKHRTFSRRIEIESSRANLAAHGLAPNGVPGKIAGAPCGPVA